MSDEEFDKWISEIREGICMGIVLIGFPALCVLTFLGA